MSKVGNEENFKALTAEDRLKRLCDISNDIQIDINVPARRYYKSGVQMVRMADMHAKENHLEDAFILYMKYITLFVEKIREHPDLKSVPLEDVSETMHKLKEILQKAENLKKKMLDVYTADHNHYLQQKNKGELLFRERKEKEEEKEKKKKVSENEKHVNTVISKGVRNISSSKENIITPVPYLPDDFLVYEIPDNKLIPLTKTTSTITTKPGVDRSTKPEYNSYSNSLYNSSLKTVIIPSKMLDTFLVLAEKNTNNNIETCGILTGKLKQNRLVITHLLIPKQYGTSDSCTTDNEEDLFNYQNEHNLITLGWIHTHPSQTAFLSSVDLHTHYSYQLMMSESIAIVCAPRYSETGFFRLTPHYGLDFIANCKQKDFHPHPSDPPLFQEADHCTLDENASVEVVDLRR